MRTLAISIALAVAVACDRGTPTESVDVPPASPAPPRTLIWEDDASSASGSKIRHMRLHVGDTVTLDSPGIHDFRITPPPIEGTQNLEGTKITLRGTAVGNTKMLQIQSDGTQVVYLIEVLPP